MLQVLEEAAEREALEAFASALRLKYGSPQ